MYEIPVLYHRTQVVVDLSSCLCECGKYQTYTISISVKLLVYCPHFEVNISPNTLFVILLVSSLLFVNLRTTGALNAVYIDLP